MIKLKLKAVLATRKMTQKELAERTGARLPTISAIFMGSIKHMPVKMLNQICRVLNCQPEDLMEYVSDETDGEA